MVAVDHKRGPLFSEPFQPVAPVSVGGFRATQRQVSTKSRFVKRFLRENAEVRGPLSRSRRACLRDDISGTSLTFPKIRTGPTMRALTDVPADYSACQRNQNSLSQCHCAYLSGGFRLLFFCAPGFTIFSFIYSTSESKATGGSLSLMPTVKNSSSCSLFYLRCSHEKEGDIAPPLFLVPQSNRNAPSLTISPNVYIGRSAEFRSPFIEARQSYCLLRMLRHQSYSLRGYREIRPKCSRRAGEKIGLRQGYIREDGPFNRRPSFHPFGRVSFSSPVRSLEEELIDDHAPILAKPERAPESPGESGALVPQ